MKIRLLGSASVLLCALGALASFPLDLSATPKQDVATLAAEIKKDRDEVDPAKLTQLAGLRTREAMEALIAAYDGFGSIYMRLEALRALALFDGVEEAQQKALEKIMNVASSSPEPELREGAILALGNCPKLGKHFLQLIVDSPAEDAVREQAMKLHVKQATEEDFPWYEKLFKAGLDEKGGKGARKKAGKDDPPELKVHSLPAIREMALEQIAPKMEAKALVEHAKEKERDSQDLRKDGIRRIALQELHRRKDKRAVDVAKDVLKDVVEKSPNRIVAARILFEEQGAKLANQFLEEGRKGNTPLDLAYAMADMIVEMKDPQIEAKLVKLVGKGDGREKLFVLRAVRGAKDEKLDKEIAKLLADPEHDMESNVPVGVRIEAARVLGERKSKDSLPALENLVNTATREDVIAAGIDAISAIRAGDPEWAEKLLAHAANPKTEIQNAALLQLGRGGDKSRVPVLVKALESDQWATRFAALKGLEAMRSAEAVTALVARMQKEEGRMLHEFADALWRLTGQPYRTVATSWKGWWEQHSGDFTPISAEELAKREAEETARRQKQLTRATFFGIRIESHRVIFIIDVSGSMNELTRPAFADKLGEPRMTVAQRELCKCIDSLEPNSLFNVISFSSGVEPWLDGIAEGKAKTRDEAKAWVNKLGANGGTNIYGAIREAFRDQDVDTIFFLSDGEPSVGDVVDQGMIREHVKLWNEHRGVVINCIAVGGAFSILEWLAADSGGTHVRIP